MNLARISSRLSRFHVLPDQEQRVLLSALLLLPLNAGGLRLIGFRRWRAVISWWLATHRRLGKPAEPDFSISPQRIAQLVFAASHEGQWTGACLERSLVLWWLLRRRNFSAELHVGVRRQVARFEAHAWVQLDNVVLNDDEALLNYVPFENPVPLPGGRLR
jgi:hypothetical protein